MKGPPRELEKSVDAFMDWFMALVMPAIIVLLVLVIVVLFVGSTIAWLTGGFDSECIVHDGLEYCR